MGRSLTIRRRLKLLLALFVASVVAVASLVGAMLYQIDTYAEEIEENWISATNILADIDNRLLRFRIDQAYRALAPDEQERLYAESLASRRRTEIKELLVKFESLPEPFRTSDLLNEVKARLEAFFDSHDAWVAEDPSASMSAPARAASPQHILYRAADEAIVRLMNTVRQGALSNAAYVDRAVDAASVLLFVLTLLALGTTAAIVLRLRNVVLRPLEAITDALERLTHGDRKVYIAYQERADEVGALARACLAFRDSLRSLERAKLATEQVLAANERLARYDALTGLPNATLFATQIQAALARAQRDGTVAYVFIININRFKPITDLHGAAVGEQILCEIAHRLREEAPEDVLARLEGDEFALLARGLTASLAGTSRLAERLLSAIRRPISIGAVTIELSARVGIAVGPTDGVDPGDLLRAADLAMNRAKGASVSFFEPGMDQELRAEATFDAEVRHAVEQGLIMPWFQPVVELKTGSPVGVELLARWNRDGAFISPAVFIPVVERLGLMTCMTRKLMRTAIHAAADWPPAIHLAVNIAPSQLKEPDLATQLLSLLHAEGFDPNRLEIEVTEDALIGDNAAVHATLKTFQLLGAKLVLDDFGTGYSGFYQLKQVTFDKLKIDQSYVRGMKNVQDSRIVDAMINLAAALAMEVVAEGVEEEWMVERLVAKGCRFAQGYHFARPMPAEDLRRLFGSMSVS